MQSEGYGEAADAIVLVEIALVFATIFKPIRK